MDINSNSLKALVGAVLVLLTNFTYAEETKMEKVETKAHEASDSVKGAYRDAKDKACELINGKMECVGKKIKNKTETAVDKAGTKATELKKKFD
ncbi:MAG: hypothetical protein K2X47_03690 [Bdellovibrionales bacterium]|nr:hypothetical protein [Bdellovibrionales bacterium]